MAERSFPRKLYEVVDGAQHAEVVSWCEEGRAFVVRDLPRFCEEVLPLYFEEGCTKWEFFEQQLSLYGFERISQVTQREGSVFRHTCFQRNQRQLLDSFEDATGTVALEIKETTEAEDVHVDATSEEEEAKASAPMKFLCCFDTVTGVKTYAAIDLLAAFLVFPTLFLALAFMTCGAWGLRAPTSVWHAKMFYYAKCFQFVLSLFVTPYAGCAVLDALFRAGALCVYTLYGLLLARAHYHAILLPKATVAVVQPNVPTLATSSLTAPLLVVVSRD